jgi:2,4-dienoyl-CoA reductase-like NADH-dependent reductase (Old Yellow Enzyme family)
MGRENYKIYSEGRIGSLVLKNRLVRSATCDYQAGEGGKVTSGERDIYRRLAEGGAGFIITGLMAVVPEGVGTKGQHCIYDDTCIPEIAKLASAVHETENQCRIMAQLCHPGRQVPHKVTAAECIGPSAVESPLLVRQAREMSQDDIKSMVAAFAEAILRVKQAGFDGVQLHAAHGYLLSSFLSPYTNHRTDSYGGDTRNRVRIIKEIVTLARDKAGDFPILVKCNCDDHIPGGISRDSFPELAVEIAGTGADALEISGGMWDCLVRTEEALGFVPVPIPESRVRIDSPDKQSYYYTYVKALRLPVPLILTGGHRNIEHMEKLIREGTVDFLSLSRPLICEPDLPERWLKGNGSDRSGCVSCNACLVLKDEFSCALQRHRLNRPEFEAGFSNGWREVFK